MFWVFPQGPFTPPDARVATPFILHFVPLSLFFFKLLLFISLSALLFFHLSHNAEHNTYNFFSFIHFPLLLLVLIANFFRLVFEHKVLNAGTISHIQYFFVFDVFIFFLFFCFPSLCRTNSSTLPKRTGAPVHRMKIKHD